MRSKPYLARHRLTTPRRSLPNTQHHRRDFNFGGWEVNKSTYKKAYVVATKHDVELGKRLRIEQHGSSADQKQRLVAKILARFQQPDQWPCTDAERIEFLRGIYNDALIIQQTIEDEK